MKIKSSFTRPGVVFNAFKNVPIMAVNNNKHQALKKDAEVSQNDHVIDFMCSVLGFSEKTKFNVFNVSTRVVRNQD